MDKVIKTKADCEEVLAAVEKLMDLNPDVGTPEADQLELLTLLIQDYESREYEFIPPDPVEAIKFRMEQQKLAPRDLVPYLGSRSKVSEILSKKRPLTLSMIRALHTGLGIPAKVLVVDQSDVEDVQIEWRRFPIKEMSNRGWIVQPIDNRLTSIANVLREFFAAAGPLEAEAILYRKSGHIRCARSMDDYALAAWSARILAKAFKEPLSVEYEPNTVNLDFMRQVAQISSSDNGPLEVRDFLRSHGIVLAVERHLPRTYLDGAAFIVRDNRPVIGLTLRHDRIDNFWFSLMHELAHVCLHYYEEEFNYFYDDLDIETGDDPREKEADQLASEALIPAEAWERSAARHSRIPEAAELLANQLGIHPAIVAGRMRYESKSYRLLNNLMGHREVQKLFPEVKWR